MTVTKSSKSRRIRETKLMYNILNSIISGILMVILYFYYIIDLPKDINQLGIIIIASFLTGLIGSWIARGITKEFSHIVKPINEYFRSFFIIIIYGFMIWIGVITYIWDNFNLLQIIIIWLGLKIFVFTLSDLFADNIAFGG